MTDVPRRAAADWLELRGAADEEARDNGSSHLLGALTAYLAESGMQILQVVDLGAGTGANRRYLEPRLRCPQKRVVVDHDAEHLRHPAHAGSIRVRAGIGGLSEALEGVSVPDGGVRLLTCAALLDVLTEAELAPLARLVVDGGGPAVFALTVDGRVQWSPDDPADDVVGLVANLSTTGEVTVRSAQTDWQLGPGTPRLLRRWLDERVQAALDQEPSLRGELTAWRERRLAQLRSGRLQVQVGHTDVLVLPSRTT